MKHEIWSLLTAHVLSRPVPELGKGTASADPSPSITPNVERGPTNGPCTVQLGRAVARPFILLFISNLIGGNY